MHVFGQQSSRILSYVVWLPHNTQQKGFYTHYQLYSNKATSRPGMSNSNNISGSLLCRRQQHSPVSGCVFPCCCDQGAAKIFETVFLACRNAIRILGNAAALRIRLGDASLQKLCGIKTSTGSTSSSLELGDNLGTRQVEREPQLVRPQEGKRPRRVIPEDVVQGSRSGARGV